EGVRRYGKRIAKKLNGQEQLSVDDAVIAFLALRLQQLQQVLDKRGHASQARIAITIPHQQDWQKGRLLKPLKIARAHPEWSALNKKKWFSERSRNQAVKEIAQYMSESSAPL